MTANTGQPDTADGDDECERCGRVPVLDAYRLVAGHCPVCVSWIIEDERGDR